MEATGGRLRLIAPSPTPASAPRSITGCSLGELFTGPVALLREPECDPIYPSSFEVTAGVSVLPNRAEPKKHRS